MSILYEVFLKMTNVSGKILEKIQLQFTFNDLFEESLAVFWDCVRKYCRARQASDDYTTHALCMLHN